MEHEEVPQIFVTSSVIQRPAELSSAGSLSAMQNPPENELFVPAFEQTLQVFHVHIRVWEEVAVENLLKTMATRSLTYHLASFKS